jgi:hypothetical protein
LVRQSRLADEGPPCRHGSRSSGDDLDVTSLAHLTLASHYGVVITPPAAAYLDPLDGDWAGGSRRDLGRNPQAPHRHPRSTPEQMLT